jgi:hypothetical protein
MILEDKAIIGQSLPSATRHHWGDGWGGGKKEKKKKKERGRSRPFIVGEGHGF